jgi:hypothetical protein
MYVCVCVYVNVCTYVCMFANIYIYTIIAHTTTWHGHVQPSIHPHIQKIHACMHINTEEIHLWKIPPRAQYDLFESRCARVREGL